MRRPVSIVPLLVLLAGCPTPPEPEPEPDDDDSASIDDDDDDDTWFGASQVRGVVLDHEGVPIEALAVSLCGAICQIAQTDAAGVFVIEDVAAGAKVIEPTVAPVAPGQDLADAVRTTTRFFDFVTVVEGEDFEFEQPFVILPVDGAVGPLAGEQTLDFGHGLVASFDADRILDEGAMPAGADEVWLGAISLPEERWPLRGLGDWTIEAAWAFAIWDLEAVDTFTVTATLPAPLAGDREVAFLVADYVYGFTEGRFYEEPAELDADGVTLRTPADGGLDRSTMWLAVSRP